MSKPLSYEFCSLCARRCEADRTHGKIGFCGVGDEILIGRAALHEWEEPIISGTRGSGTIFFSGCSLGCVYCQNFKISKEKIGKSLSVRELVDIMFKLKECGAHNINLVTPTHCAISIKEALITAKREGLDLPIVYNTASYDTLETLKSLEGLVDVYLPDLKYYRSETAKKLSCAENYVSVARDSIAEMVRQQPCPVIKEGIMRSGVVVRILLLPGHTAEAKLSLKYLHEKYGDSIYISLMSQYTPIANMSPPLNRKVTVSEYSELVEYAERLGFVNCFIQDKESAEEGYIPPFDAKDTIL